MTKTKRSSQKGFNYEGYIDYQGIGRIYDSDVYNLIKSHSRFIDRLNKKKMVEMSLLGQCALMGIFNDMDPSDASWQFYGKNSPLKKGKG